MISRKTLRIAGAAILGTLVGTGPAYATIEMPAGETDADDITGKVVIANETLVARVGDTDFGQIVGAVAGGNIDTATSGSLFVENDLGLRVNITSGTLARVTYNLTNLVFDNVVADAHLVLEDTTGTVVPNTLAGVRVTKLSGGTQGSDTVTFSLSGGTDGVDCGLSDSGCRVYLKLANIGIMADADGASGSIAMESAVTIGGQVFNARVSLPDVITTVNALSESVSPADENPQADVASGFQRFVGGSAGTQTASIGTVHLGVKSTPTGGTTVASTNTIVSSQFGGNPVPLLGATNNIAASGTVTFAGDLTFVTDVFRSTDSCATSAGSLVTGTDEKTWATEISVGDFSASHDICIRTDGETAMPATSAYTVTTSYVGITSALFPPSGSTSPLGRISRNGTKVHIPYLTTFGSYNQRIVMRNRGTSAAAYTMTFAAEDGTTYVAGDGARGTLAADSVTVVRARDAVTISGGTRVAATIDIESTPQVVDVATVQVNTSTGSTDTVRYSDYRNH